MQIYTPSELTNEQYHKEVPAISGSGLHTIYKFSPAHYKYAESEESPALAFGTAAHAMLLEPEAFNATYVRGFDASVYPDSLSGVKDMQSWLKERGQKVSGNKSDLIDRILAVEPLTHIADVLEQRYNQWNAGKEPIKPELYDKIQSMRKTIFADEKCAAMLQGGHAELSVVGELDGVDVKVRPDLITGNGGLVNYKTTEDCHPERFGRKAYDYGYLLKASLEWDMFAKAYGQQPKFYILLSQEKKSPFAFKPYYLTEEQIELGRAQYRIALAVYEQCLANDRWPAYGTGPAELYLPDYIMNQVRT